MENKRLTLSVAGRWAVVPVRILRVCGRRVLDNTARVEREVFKYEFSEARWVSVPNLWNNPSAAMKASSAASSHNPCSRPASLHNITEEVFIQQRDTVHPGFLDVGFDWWYG